MMILMTENMMTENMMTGNLMTWVHDDDDVEDKTYEEGKT